jgi:hypothetical protein
MAIRYRNFKNIVIDGGYFLKGIFPGHVQEFRRDQYEASIVEQLDTIWDRWAGWAVIRAIIDSGKTVTIVPYSEADKRKMGAGNAYAIPAGLLGGWNAAPAGAEIYRGGTDDPKTPEDERYRKAPLLRGTGRGTDVDIHYTPEDHSWRCPTTFAPLVKSGCRFWGDDESTDTVLVHEMVHALRMMYGQSLQAPTYDKRYDNEEEFFAVLVANIYMAERGLALMRADHQSDATLSRKLNTSQNFLGRDEDPPTTMQLENRRLVHKFICQNHTLCAHISGKSTAWFNPIREYMSNYQLYPLFGVA